MKYRLGVAPSPFRESYVFHQQFSWWIGAWQTAFWLTVSNPYAEVTIQQQRQHR